MEVLNICKGGIDVRKLLQQDCLEALRDMESNSVHTIVTDPPYAIPTNHFISGDPKWKRKWSDVSVLSHWWEYVVSQLVRVLKPTGHLYVFCNADSYAAFYPSMYNAFEKTFSLIWDKTTPGYGYIWRRQHEFIIGGRNKDSFKIKKWGDGDVLSYKIVPSSKRIHPAEKPVALIREILRTVTPPDGIVLDPFAGSGSTLVAAQQEGFSFIGTEKEKEYFDSAIERLKRHGVNDQIEECEDTL